MCVVSCVKYCARWQGTQRPMKYGSTSVHFWIQVLAQFVPWHILDSYYLSLDTSERTRLHTSPPPAPFLGILFSSSFKLDKDRKSLYYSFISGQDIHSNETALILAWSDESPRKALFCSLFLKFWKQILNCHGIWVSQFSWFKEILYLIMIQTNAKANPHNHVFYWRAIGDVVKQIKVVFDLVFSASCPWKCLPNFQQSLSVHKSLHALLPQ